jgi:hypothetical protein
MSKKHNAVLDDAVKIMPKAQSTWKNLKRQSTLTLAETEKIEILSNNELYELMQDSSADMDGSDASRPLSRVGSPSNHRLTIKKSKTVH